MAPGDSLSPGQSISSSNGTDQLTYHTNGDLVLTGASTQLWHSATAGQAAGVCYLQGDGNLVIYAPGSHPVWASNTSGHGGAALTLGDDGSLHIHSPDGSIFWSAN